MPIQTGWFSMELVLRLKRELPLPSSEHRVPGKRLCSIWPGLVFYQQQGHLAVTDQLPIIVGQEHPRQRTVPASVVYNKICTEPFHLANNGFVTRVRPESLCHNRQPLLTQRVRQRFERFRSFLQVLFTQSMYINCIEVVTFNEILSVVAGNYVRR